MTFDQIVVSSFSFLAITIGIGAQEILPFPEPPSESVTGRTLQESVHQRRTEPNRLPADAPNIVIVMMDDAGYGNADTFGGPVHTPTLSRLAQRGIAYNRFHTTAMCSPTRASLLTGRNHHHVGAGVIAEFAANWDGYVGRIPRSTATMPKVLSHYGYDTAAFGKWHNTPVDTITPMGPFDQWPLGLGFNYFYGFLAGETSQYEPRLFENTNAIEPRHDEDYHLTEDMAEKTIRWIRTKRALAPESPFLVWFTPGAVHGPHQVSIEWADKYKGKFDQGWEKLREETFNKQKQLGWIPDNAVLPPIEPGMQRWSDIPESQRAFQTRLMEVYAGFLEHADAQVGKVVDEIERLGLTENTLIFYIMSDNGASAEGMSGSISELLAQNGMVSTIDEHISVLNEDYGGMKALGGRMLDTMYHHGWAWAGDSPLRSTKLISSHFGGTRTPMVISWPGHIRPDNTPRSQFHHVNDIAPTVYDILKITPPKLVDGVEQEPLDGVSMVYSFDDPSAKGKKLTQYFECLGSRGIYHDGWLAGTVGPKLPWIPGLGNIPTWNPENDPWELYNLSDDFTQAKDLSSSMPKKLESMKEIFVMEATKNNVFPIGGSVYISVFSPKDQMGSNLTEWNFSEGQTRIGEVLAPRFVNRSTLATIDVELPDQASGVLFAVGGISAGFTVYMDAGKLYAEYNAMTLNRYKVVSETPVAAGKARIEVETRFEPNQRGGPATITFRVNGRQAGQGRAERTVPTVFTASETFDVGMDLGSPVSLDYHERAPFAFNGKIESISVKYID